MCYIQNKQAYVLTNSTHELNEAPGWASQWLHQPAAHITPRRRRIEMTLWTVEINTATSSPLVSTFRLVFTHATSTQKKWCSTSRIMFNFFCLRAGGLAVWGRSCDELHLRLFGSTGAVLQREADGGENPFDMITGHLWHTVTEQQPFYPPVSTSTCPLVCLHLGISLYRWRPFNGFWTRRCHMEMFEKDGWMDLKGRRRQP